MYILETTLFSSSNESHSCRNDETWSESLLDRHRVIRRLLTLVRSTLALWFSWLIRGRYVGLWLQLSASQLLDWFQRPEGRRQSESKLMAGTWDSARPHYLGMNAVTLGALSWQPRVVQIGRNFLLYSLELRQLIKRGT